MAAAFTRSSVSFEPGSSRLVAGPLFNPAKALRHIAHLPGYSTLPEMEAAGKIPKSDHMPLLGHQIDHVTRWYQHRIEGKR